MNGIIFDMDGVLFPTEELKFKAYQKVFKDLYDINIQETPERLGLAEAKVMALFLNMHNKQVDLPKVPELIQKKREAYYSILAETDFKPLAGVEDFLKEIKASGLFKIGLATVSNQKSTDILMEIFGFRKYFDSILSLEHIEKPKPDPEIYLLSAERLGVAPKECVVFEDSLAGLESARRAGMCRIGVVAGAGVKQIGACANLIIKDFRDINVEEVKKLLVNL